MTTFTLAEATDQAKRELNRAKAKALNCAGMYGYRKCIECRLYLTCQLQETLRQRIINFDELESKTKQDEKENQQQID